MKNFFACIFLLGNIVFSTAIAQSGGEQCFTSPTNPTNVYAKTTWTYNAGNQTYTFRTTFAKTFVDNTYGTNIIGWPKDHKFGDMVGSDHLQMALYDAANTKKLEFKIDYLTSSNTVASGYKSLGVTGGDGNMLTGSASDVVSAKTSLDANFNDFGYVLTTNSPATTATYAPNASYPNWIYDVWYEVTVKASAFGASGFGKPVITDVHASPSKTGNKSEDVDPSSCPGELKLGNLVWDDINNDGIKQSGEVGIGGLVVRLYVDANGDNIPDGNAVATAITNGSGIYAFTGLSDGKYIIGVVKASGYSISATTATSANPNNDIDNDNNGVVNTSSEVRTNFITLAKDTEPTNDGDDNNGNQTLDVALFRSSIPSNDGEICFVSPTNPTNVFAKTTWNYNATNQTYTFRTTFAKTFVDNTYGTNAIGWGSKGHSFSNLVGSDHLQFALYDAANTKKLEFKIDYITSSSAATGGYKSLGVTGGDGKMLTGNASDITAAKTSLDANFNDYGYVLTNNSPATDANYTPNPSYPNWIYDVWYEVTVKASAFGTSGFGKPVITGIHASPSKTGNNSEDVEPGPCPGDMKLGNLIWDDVNNDGIKQSTEKGIAGLIVYLYNDANGDNIPDGAAISSTTTDANGFYYFSSLQEGKYIVGVIKSGGYSLTATTANSANPNSDIDNDNNGIHDCGNEIRTNFITLIKGSEPTNDGDGNNGNLTLDIGLYKVNLPPSGGEICFASPTNASCVNARIQYSINNNNGTITLRTIFSKCFVDNTYGTNTVGWGSKSHSFNNLVGSDHLQLALYDANNVKKLDFKLDYITSTNTVPSGYRSLGVTGGDGKMILGEESDILNSKTSLDANFNDFGYILTSNSPATDGNYTPNAAYPNWIYDVWYETTIKLSAFGAAGFGTAEIASVHASPSKTGNNTEVVVPVSCPSLLKLGNLVFNDQNNNGLKDAGEPGVSGATVKLYRDANGDNVPDGTAIATTTTDGIGNYLFSNLAAGNYIVGVTIPAGHEPAITTATSAESNNDTDNDNNGIRTVIGELRSNFITLSVLGEPTNDGDDSNGNLTLDFGVKAIVSTNMNLGNLVWNDLNVNGVKDATESGMPNVRVRLYKDVDGDNTPDGAAIDSMLTNASGNYNFTNLAEGKYIVGVVLPTNFMATIGISSSFNPDNDIDNDNNGIVTVNNNEVQTRFITLLSNSEPTNDGDGANGNLTLDIGLFVCGNLIIGDYVWNDTNGNGLQGEDEYGIADVKVTLVSADGSKRILYTDANGYYYFTNLNAGTYTVQFETPVGFRPTIANNGLDDRDSDPINGEVVVVLTSTLPGNITIDAGFVLVKLNLGNLVFNDLNKNGVRDVGEPGIPGLRVNLYRDDNADNTPDGLRIATMLTDANGIYNFADLITGNYIVGVEINTNTWSNGPVTPTGINPNNNVDNDNNGIITLNSEIFSLYISLSPGDEPTNDGDGADGNLTLDFGLVSAPLPPFNLTLGNTVWNDVNGNGIYDNNEKGIGGLKVWLYKDDNGDNIPDGPAIDSTTTSAFDGTYGFNNLDDGKYIVGVQMPTGYLLGNIIGSSNNPDNDIDNDNNGIRIVNGEVRSNFITLLSGTEPTNDGDDNNGNLTLDFGFRPLSNGSIGDLVWHDLNRNGIQDAGEPGFAGVIVKLTLPGGSVLTTTTNAAGMYSFSNLLAGTYTVCFVTPIPTAYIPSPAGMGGDITKDSDPVNGCVTVVLAAGENNNNVDAGFYDDIDDDNDGIPDIVEGHGYDALMDCDNDGIPNYLDPTPGCPTPPGLDTYGQPFKPLVWSDCPRPGFPTGDGINDFFDHDNDGVIDELDLDSDNDGILDAWETRDPRMVDANRDGMVDGLDSDGDGLMDSADQTPFVYGGPGLIPQDLDRDGIPNYLDLDSDGDGISDLTEAREYFDNDGLADGIDTDGDGVNDVYDQIVGFGARGVDLLDRDNDGYPNPYDIDSDNDGITDNVEGQPTCSEKQPSNIDADGDGMDDVYDSNISSCIRKAPGITPFDKDGDGIPDIYDLDTDNDGAPDVNEGSGITGNFVTNFNDTDKDGLIDQFDVFNILTATEKFHHNVAHSEMGPNGNFDGPMPSGSNAGVPGDACSAIDANRDRAWRSIAILPVSLLEFRGNVNNNLVKLTWIVTSESNVSHYNVERSVDGRYFAVVGKVSANNITGLSTYTSTDDVSNLSKTTVYYRLQQIEKTGEMKYSHIVNFKLNSIKEMDINVYPNPASQYFTIKVKSDKDATASFRVMDMTGRTLIMKAISLSAGTNAINFDDLGKFASGTYTIQAIINGEVYHQKLMINR